MQRSPITRAAAALAVTALVIQAGCTADGPGMPSAPDVPEVRHSLEGGYTVLNAQLSATTSDATAYGHVQLKLLPPNPIIPNDPVHVAISGMIFNPDGDDISTDAGIYLGDLGLGDGGILVAPLTVPTPPPIRVTLDETISISAELAGQLRSSPGSYFVKYGSISGSLGGARAQPGSPPI